MERDYTGKLLGISSETARDFAKGYPWKFYPLVYRAGWVKNPLTGISERCADAVCGRCGAKMKLMRAGFDRVSLFLDDKIVNSGDTCKCPDCGQSVTAVHVSEMWRTKSYAWVMEPRHVAYRAGVDALALMIWRVMREFGKDAAEVIEVEPYEAYIVEKDSIVCCKHWQNNFRGVCTNTGWRQNKRFSDTLGDIDIAETCGDIHAAMLGTTAENSKLDLYMRQAETSFPVAYLRLWQKHKNVETLLTCGAGRLLGELIEKEKRRIPCTYGVQLKDLDWKAKKPNDILLMSKAELRAMRDTAGVIEAMLGWRKAGLSIRLPEDTEKLRKYSLNEWRFALNAGVAPDKAARYLTAQKRRFPKEDMENRAYLRDYWKMAETAGLDLRDKTVLFPAHLRRAHDQLIQQQKFRENEALWKNFARRAKALARFDFAADGLLIRAPQNESELIAEGKILNHCVASYATRHANGETTILFIRQEGEPDLPYFTLNINEGKGTVIQNYGRHNCAPTAEVERFVEKFVSWWLAGCCRDEKGAPVGSRVAARKTV